LVTAGLSATFSTGGQRATSFQRWAGLFELNIFMRKLFSTRSNQGGKMSDPNGQSICPVPGSQ